MDDGVKLRFEAGQIARKAILQGAKMIKPGVLLKDICDTVEQRIKKEGASLAFPTQINLNHIAAHYCPDLNDKTEIKEGDIVKLDCGSHIQGYVADNAVTVDLGTGTDLKKASDAALKAAIKLCKPGNYTHELGKAIEDQAQNFGFSPIRNLSGHGIGRWDVHCSPSVPNYNPGNGIELKEGMAIAIEPFVTNGEGLVVESAPINVFMMKQKKPVRSQFAREALKIIETYNGLPFARRWLEEKMGSAKANFGLNELVKMGVLTTYGPLVERKNGLVSQSEHSVIIQKGNPLVITELDE